MAGKIIDALPDSGRSDDNDGDEEADIDQQCGPVSLSVLVSKSECSTDHKAVYREVSAMKSGIRKGKASLRESRLRTHLASDA